MDATSYKSYADRLASWGVATVLYNHGGLIICKESMLALTEGVMSMGLSLTKGI